MKKTMLLSLFVVIAIAAMAYCYEYTCQCGGKLEWSAKAWKEWVTCPSCHGKGKLYGGYECTMCDGSGQVEEWHSGCVCKKCGEVYADD